MYVIRVPLLCKNLYEKGRKKERSDEMSHFCWQTQAFFGQSSFGCSCFINRVINVVWRDRWKSISTKSVTRKFSTEKHLSTDKKEHQMKVMNKKRFRKGSNTLAYRNKKSDVPIFDSLSPLACVSKRINARLASKLILKWTIEKNS